jgi:hypothetical protein
MPEEPTIILLNRALPFNCVGKLTGWSGVEYATSAHEEVYGGQVCRLPLSRWREIKQDVTTGFARRACQWEVDVEAKNEESGRKEGTTAEPVETFTTEALARITNYQRLLSLARRAGVEQAEAIDTTAGLREAILSKQGGQS